MVDFSRAQGAYLWALSFGANLFAAPYVQENVTGGAV